VLTESGGNTAKRSAGAGAKEVTEEERLARVIQSHRFHIDKLEDVTRLLDNAIVDADDVDAVKDDID
jgi:CCR4-NOT transcriptional regulation complex NOT5 subunit